MDQQIICLNRVPSNYEREYDLGNKVLHLISKHKLARLAELKGIVSKVKPDIVYAWGSSEYIYALALKAIMQDFSLINGSIRHGIRLRSFGHYLRLILLHLSKYIIANSEAGLRVNALKKSKNRWILNNGIDERFRDVDPLRSEKVRMSLGIRRGIFTFASVANFVPYKDYFTVLKALKELCATHPDFGYIYLMIGDGPLKEKVLNFAKELSIDKNIKAVGIVENVQDYLSVADLFIHSSRGEGCSNAILEAMHAGLPIVASDTGGNPEILEPSFGELFRYKDADDLCRKLESVVFRHDIGKMGQAARSQALNRFHAKGMVDNFYLIIEKILDNAA